MLEAHILVPCRFLSIVGHLCVVITLLWESQLSVMHCLPSQYHQTHLEVYHNQLIGGYGASIAMLLLELLTYLTGLTMFSSTTSLLSTLCHSSAAILLTYFLMDFWLCDWYWIIFTFCSVIPFLVDTFTAILTILSKNLY